MSASFFGPTPGGGGGSVTVTNFPNPQPISAAINTIAVGAITNGADVNAGTTTDAVIAAGAVGTLSSKIRKVSADIGSLVTGVVLAAGTAIIGKVGIDQTTPGTTNAVSVVNPSGFPTSVRVQGLSGALGDTTSWDGSLATPFSAITQMSAGSIANAAVEAISVSAADSTLTQIALSSEFLSVVVYNPTGTDCTVTLGNANATTITCKQFSSLQMDGHWSKLVLHATASGQQLIGQYYNPAVT